MKTEGRLFVGIAIFFLLLTVVYGVWSRDITGILLLLFTFCFSFLIGFFLLNTSRRVFPRPEDRPDGNIDEADPDYGFYSPHSWWPLPLAASMATIAFGWVFAAWIVVAGTAFLFLSLIGFMFEYYRGDHAH